MSRNNDLNSSRASFTGCDEVIELIPAYSIGATDPDETAFVRTHLAECPEATAELADYAGLSKALLYQVPRTKAPPHLLQNLQKNIQSATKPPRRKHRLYLRRYWLPLVAAIAVLFLVSLNLFLLSRLNQAQEDFNRVVSSLEQQRAALALVGSSSLQRGTLAAVQKTGDKSPWATLVSDPQKNIGVLYVGQFPPLPPNMAYQVWLSRAGQRVSAGVFKVDQAGGTIYVVAVPEAIGNYEVMGITPEPATGSAGPTGQAVVRGSPVNKQQ